MASSAMASPAVAAEPHPAPPRHDRDRDTSPQATTTARTTPPAEPDLKKLADLAPLCDALAAVVKCPICLEYMDEARQLQCGHLFCPDCVVRILGLRRVRCAICKVPTTKRMVRSASLPYPHIVRSLRVLERAVEHARALAPPAADDAAAAAVRDGIKVSVNDALHRIRNAQQQQRRIAAQREQQRTTPTSTTAPASPPPGDATPSKTTPKVCILCPKSAAPAASMARASMGKLVPVQLNQSGRNRHHVHESCAFFSEHVYALDNAILNIDKVLRDTEYTSCARDGCQQSNPTVKCAVEGCTAWMHYSCAVADGCELVEDGFKMFCVAHKDEAPKLGGDFEASLTTANDSSHVNHDSFCYICRTGGKLLMCDTCERSSHPACSKLKRIPLGDWSCGVCRGIHKLASTASFQGIARSPANAAAKRQRPEGLSADADGSTPGSQTRPGSQKRARRASEGRRLVIAHTGLKDDQSEVLLSLVKARRTTVRAEVEEKVNYVVIGVDGPDEVPTRTMKLCFAVARKVPIVCWSWVRESVQCDGAWAPIEGHVHPLTMGADEGGVLAGKRFCVACLGADKAKREQFGQLVRLAGGTVVPRGDKREGEETIYVCSEDGAGKRARGAKSRYEPPAGASVVSASWILDQLTKERLK